MDTQRLILLFIFSFSLLMLWEAWEKEQRPKPPAASAPAGPLGVPAPATPPAAGAAPVAPAAPGAVPTTDAKTRSDALIAIGVRRGLRPWLLNLCRFMWRT